MASFKKDMNKLTYKEIEAKPGRLAGQIVLNQLYDNDFHMWFIGNTEGNQLYTVTLSNEEKAIVGFINETIASNYINRSSIITLINKYGFIDGSHHKQWILTKIVKILLGSKGYKKWVDDDWDEGIVP